MQKNNTLTQYRIDLKEKILRISMQEFLKKGIKAVKMDDIANKLLISKRTLYEIYANKEDLLFEGLKEIEDSYDEYMSQFSMTPGHGVMEIIIEFYRLQMDKLSTINPLFFSELHKYGKIVNYLSQKHSERDKKSQEFFTRAAKEGYFRSDVDYEIIGKIGNKTVQGIMDDKMYTQYSLSSIFKNMLLLFIRGLCTDKGIKIIDEKLPVK